MSHLRNTKTAKAVAGIVSVLTGLVMLAPAAGAATTADLQAQIQALLAQIATLQAQLGTSGSTTTTGGYTFNKNLKMGMTDTDVMNLQKVLNMSASTQVASSGAGSPGNESSYFGAKTKAAVIKYQTNNGISPASGYVGPITRAKLNATGGTTTGGTTTGGTTTGGTTTGTAGSLTVTAGVQPANSLAVMNAVRVPFTTFTLTAGSSDVTVTGVNVTRSGLAQDSDFSGVVLLDGNGMQLDIAKTFGSTHQATVGGTFTVKAGTSQTFTVAGNIAAAPASGDVASITVTGVNTSATVAGAFPITGSSQTMNNALTIGTLTGANSSYDPGTATNQPIGTSAYRFTGVRLTAGSAEDVTLKSIRFNQSGSASANDISNVNVYVNGTAYPTTVSTDGKYYSANFGSGIVITKGNSDDVWVQADISGSGAAGRTVDFDLYKNTDIYAVGNTYNQGILYSGTVNGTSSTATPAINGYTVTVTAGTVTTIGKANEVPGQNIAVNVNNQPLGGYATNFSGEPVSVQSSVFHFGGTVGSTNLLTSVSVVDENGKVVAGPKDAVADTGGSLQKVTFTDTITYPVGRHVFTLKGKVSSSSTNGTTVIASSTPSTDWTSVTGQTTGNTVTISTASFTMNTMTVKAASATIGISATPAAQNVVAGTQGFTLANYQIDATQSGEDIRLASFPVTITTATTSELTGCQLWNGTTALNTGGNVVNTFTSATAKTYSFDNSITVAKGTVTTLALKCNVSSGAAATGAGYQASVDTTAADYTITGNTSGNSVTGTSLTLTAGSGGAMTPGTGTFTVTSAASAIAQPSLTPAAAGSTGVTIGSIKLHATNDSVNLTKLGLTLAASGGNGLYGTKSTGSGASSSSGTGDVMMAYLYNGSTQVGTAAFTGNSTTATSSLNITLPRDTDVVLTIKADLGAIGVSSSGGIGDTIAIDPLNAEGTGASSGTTIKVAATKGVNGVQLVKSYPTVAFVSNALNPNGTNVVLKKFTVTANASGPVSLWQLTFSVATSSASVTSGKLYAYTDSGYSQGLSSQSSGTGQIGSTACASGCASNTQTWTFTAATNPITIPAGTTYYFALLGTVTPTSTANNWTISPTLQGDSAVQANLGTAPTYIATTTNAVSTANFVWSDNATTTANIATGTDVDWFNGYQIPGLPGTGI